MAMPRQQLRHARKRAGLSQQQMAKAIGVAPETYASWERGTATPRDGFRPRIADELDVTLPEVDLWLDGEATPPNGYRLHGDLDTYASLEQGARRIWACEPLVIHGLVQTRAYARAVEAADPALTTAMALERVELRLSRQQALDRPTNPLHLSIVLGEAALRQVADNPGVMVEQLDYLVTCVEAGKVELRVLPFASGVFAAAWGAFSLMASGNGDQPTMAFVENRTGLTYLSKPFEIEPHMELFTHLWDSALNPAESADFIRLLSKEHQQ